MVNCCLDLSGAQNITRKCPVAVCSVLRSLDGPETKPYWYLDNLVNGYPDSKLSVLSIHSHYSLLLLPDIVQILSEISHCYQLSLCYQLVLAVNYGQWCPWCRYSVVTSVRPSQTRSPGLASVGQCHGASYTRSIPTSTVHSAAHFLRVPQNNCNTISLNQHIHKQYFVELYYNSYKLQLTTINIKQIN